MGLAPKVTLTPPDLPASKSIRDFFSDFVVTQPAQQAALEAAMKWVRATYEGQSLGLILWSEVYGVGKTHLAHAAHAALQYTGKAEGAMLTAPDFLDIIKSSYSDDSPRNEYELFNTWKKGYIILDDIGKEYIKEKTWADEKYFRLIDGLVNAHSSLLITSNLHPKKLGPHLGGAAWSRVGGLVCDNSVNMSALADYRLKGK